MPIHATINERTLRRTFREQVKGKRALTVLDTDLRGFALKVSANGNKTFIVRAARRLGTAETVLGSADELTAAQAREKAAALIEAAVDERRHGPAFRDFAGEFMRRHARRWKPATREGNALILRRYLVPFFAAMRVADIARADVERWFDSMSATPGNANRALPVLSVMMRQAELWDLRPQGSNPCRGVRRYKMKPRERFLSLDELKRLGFVLDHAEDAQAAAAIRLLLFTGARSSEITGLRWDWIRGTRAVLPDSKTGPRTVWLGPEAARLLAALHRPEGAARVFPEDLTPARLYTFWRAIREEAGLPGLRIHDARHTWASQGVMNGVGLTTVGRLLGHSKRRTTAIYAHLDDAALQGAAAQAAAVIAGAMGYKAAPPPLPDGADGSEGGETPDTPAAGDAGAVRPAPPDKPPAHGLRRWSDRERSVPARSEPSGPAEQPGGTEASANPGGKAPRRRLPGLIPI